MYDHMTAALRSHLGPKHADRLCVLPIAPEQWTYQLPHVTQYQLPNNTNRFKDYMVMVRAVQWMW